MIQVKSMLTDFYSVDDLVSAKVRLLNDLKQLNLTKSSACTATPYRWGAFRASSWWYFDIIYIRRWTKLIDRLPNYVYHMPTSRLCEGDLNILILILRDIGNMLQVFELTMATKSSEVTIQSLGPSPLSGLVQFIWVNTAVSARCSLYNLWSQPAVHRTVFGALSNSCTSVIWSVTEISWFWWCQGYLGYGYGDFYSQCSDKSLCCHLESASDENDASDRSHSLLRFSQDEQLNVHDASHRRLILRCMRQTHQRVQRRSAPPLLGRAKANSANCVISAARKIKEEINVLCCPSTHVAVFKKCFHLFRSYQLTL